MKNNIYSFDVFDTCLVRLCGKPSNVFEILSEQISSILTLSEHQRQLFVSLRANTTGKSLQEIYNKICQSIEITISPDTLVQMELVLEQEVLSPVEKISKLIKSLRKTGFIIFISDMYLPSNFIRQILIKYELCDENDLIYVSCEQNASKYDASLFKKIKKELKVSYSSWIHYGDNIISDYQIPSKLGIRCHLIKKEQLPYETTIHNHFTPQFPFNSIVAGISQGLHLRYYSLKPSPFVCDISAPFIVSWVAKIMHDAEKKGITQLFFCARDTHSAFLVAKKLNPLFPNIEIKYIFVSRVSLSKSSKLVFEYFKSVGITNTDKKSAIVDFVSTGNTLRTINTILTTNGHEPCHGYFILRINYNTDNQYKDIQNTTISSYEIETTYASLNNPQLTKYSFERIIFEIFFSLNYHKTTIDYNDTGRGIVPIFGNDDFHDKWSMPNVEEQKKINDAILLQYTEAFINCCLERYASQIFDNIVLHVFERFINFPEKVYLEYLSDLQINESRLISRITPFSKTPNTLWRRGCLIYSLPKPLIEIYRKMTKAEKL